MDIDQKRSGLLGLLLGKEQVEHLALVPGTGIILITDRLIIRMSLLSLPSPTTPIKECLMLGQGNDPVLVGVNPLEISSRVWRQLFLLKLSILVPVPLLEPVSVDRKDKESGDYDKDERFHWRYNRPESQW